MTRPVRFRGRDDKGALVRGSVVTVVSAVAMFVMLSGIAECASNCPVYDENGDQVFGPDGNPVSVACINCIESNPPPCKSDAWSLAEGVACDAANQPSVPDGTACDFSEDGDGTCTAGVCDGPRFPCTEQGVLDAIAAGGGPRYFDCPGPTTINTTAEVVIDNDVTLDFEGLVTLDAGGAHRVVAVPAGVTAELRGLTVTGGLIAPTDTRCDTGGLQAGHGLCNAGSLTLTNVAVVSNGLVGRLVGGILSISSADSTVVPPPFLRVVDSIVSFNLGDEPYGIPSGIWATGTLEIVRSTISDNGLGPAVTVGTYLLGDQYPSTVLIEDSTISSTGDTQVSLFVPGPVDVVTFTGSTVSGPQVAASVQQSGDAVGGTLLIQDCAFTGGSGEGLFIGANLDGTVQNTSVTGGPSALSVGFNPGGSTTLINVTMVATDASNVGALSSSGNANVILQSCVLSPGCSGGGTISSLGYNIEADGDTCGFTDSTDQVNVTPAALNLGPLQDNGGPTQTFLPGPGSIAIDAIPAAECTLTTDQRGISRPQGAACDIGAVEVEQP